MTNSSYLRHHRTRAAVHLVIGFTAAASWATAIVALYNTFGLWAGRYALIATFSTFVATLTIRRAIHHVHVLEIFRDIQRKQLDNHSAEC